MYLSLSYPFDLQCMLWTGGSGGWCANLGWKWHFIGALKDVVDLDEKRRALQVRTVARMKNELTCVWLSKRTNYAEQRVRE